MNDSDLAKGYNLLKWGILITALHINIMIPVGKLAVGIQIIPAFIGYIIIVAAISKMNSHGGTRYFEKLKPQSIKVFIFSVFQFLVGILCGYNDVSGFTDMLTPAVILAMFLYELLLYADILNMTVRLFKDNNEIKSADKMRKDRIFFIKAGLALSVLYAVAMVPKLSSVMNYSCVTLTLILKLWLTMMLQNVTRMNLVLKKDEEVAVDNQGNDSI